MLFLFCSVGSAAFSKNSLRLLGCTSPTHVFIADVDDPSLLCIFVAEFVRESLQHHTRLDEIVKVDAACTSAIKHLNHQLGKLR